MDYYDEDDVYVMEFDKRSQVENLSTVNDDQTEVESSGDFFSSSDPFLLWFIKTVIEFLWGLFWKLDTWIKVLIFGFIIIRFLIPLILRILVASTDFLTCYRINACFPVKSLWSMADTNKTRDQLLASFSRLKLGVWVPDDSDDQEIPYKPLPEEARLMEEIKHELINIVSV